MNVQNYLIKRKLSLLDLGKELNNISEACRSFGVSRKHYYDIRKIIEEEGVDGLIEKSRSVPRKGNRVSEELESTLLAYSLEFPTHGQQRTSNELKKKGWELSPGGVRSIWMRHNLEVKSKRIRRLEKWSKEHNGVLTESQVKAIEESREEEKSKGEIETYYSGYLLGQDTYYVGYIKGVGNIYQQTGIDTYSNYGFAKLYLRKTALVAADFLNDKVLPFYDSEDISLLNTLTDRGKEYCGNADRHEYQLYLYLNDMGHHKTRVRNPQANGCTEKLNQTIKNEFYSVAFRKKLYSSLEELQLDLDYFMNDYNYKRTNQGKRCRGRTPYETFLEGKKEYFEKVHYPSNDSERGSKRPSDEGGLLGSLSPDRKNVNDEIKNIDFSKKVLH